jgi:beta-glucosidase
MSVVSFPKSFRFGTATASYQIEGAWNEDGKGLSIWDNFTHKKGKILDKSNGDIACDHYHLYKDDFKLMKKLNFKNYRFSISWPRIIPDGKVSINQKGIDFYKKLVDEMLKNKIEPFVTLYHWDLPQSLQDKGGWYNPDTSKYFADYVGIIVKELKDKVTYWATFNEPSVIFILGHVTGEHAPGYKNLFRAFLVPHNLLMAHGFAVQQIRSISKKLKAGIVNNFTTFYPYSPKDIKSADIANSYSVRLFMDTIFKKKYPDLIEKRIHFFNKNIKQEDFDVISTPIDYEGVRFTDMGWEIYPDAFYDLLMKIKNEYGNPEVFVTENGAAFKDNLVKGKINDIERIDYLKKYIQAMNKALKEGANIKGYFVWSFMDNFEWAFGYTKRFGVVYVDYTTQERIVKESGLWYSRLCRDYKFEIKD